MLNSVNQFWTKYVFDYLSHDHKLGKKIQPKFMINYYTTQCSNFYEKQQDIRRQSETFGGLPAP